VNEPVVRIDSDGGDPIGRKLGEVSVQQLDCTDTDSEQ